MEGVQTMSQEVPYQIIETTPSTIRKLRLPRRIVLGIGSGRCGTMSLASVLNMQENFYISHEFRPTDSPSLPREQCWEQPLPLSADPRQVLNVIQRMCRLNHAAVVGDVAFFWLPHLDYLIRSLGEQIRVVCLKRDCKATVQSFMGKTPNMNPWGIEAPGAESVWNPCFPKYDLPKEEGIQRYWEEYYNAVDILLQRYPANIKLWSTEEALNTKDGINQVLDFVGVHRSRQQLRINIRRNQAPNSRHRNRNRVPNHPNTTRAKAASNRVTSVTPFDSSELDGKVTLVIKAFERRACVVNLVNSIRLYYPTLPIFVADDSRQPVALEDVELHAILPFDTGLSAGRNFLLGMVQTPYFVLLDDDFEFHEGTDLLKLLKLLEREKLDIVGAALLDSRQHNRIHHFEGTFQMEEDVLFLSRDPIESKNDFSRVDFVLNFFLGKTDVVRKLGWDPELKICEHKDFFLRAKEKNLTVGYCPSVTVVHKPVTNVLYARYRRQRTAKYTALFMQKHKLLDVKPQGFSWLE